MCGNSLVRIHIHFSSPNNVYSVITSVSYAYAGSPECSLTALLVLIDGCDEEIPGQSWIGHSSELAG